MAMVAASHIGMEEEEAAAVAGAGAGLVVPGAPAAGERPPLVEGLVAGVVLPPEEPPVMPPGLVLLMAPVTSELRPESGVYSPGPLAEVTGGEAGLVAGALPGPAVALVAGRVVFSLAKIDEIWSTKHWGTTSAGYWHSPRATSDCTFTPAVMNWLKKPVMQLVITLVPASTALVEFSRADELNTPAACKAGVKTWNREQLQASQKLVLFTLQDVRIDVRFSAVVVVLTGHASVITVPACCSRTRPAVRRCVFTTLALAVAASTSRRAATSQEERGAAGAIAV